MLLSRACEYGIQAVLYLAEHQDSPYVSTKEIAEHNQISYYFLGKILQTLTHKGLLISYKGPKGGVRLARPSREITVLHIVEAIDGLANFEKCLVGMPACDHQTPCAFHKRWSKIRNEMYGMFEQQSIAQLLNEE